MAKQKMAFIGLGQISESHLNGLRLLNRHCGDTVLELSAVVDPFPGRAAEWLDKHFKGNESRPAVVENYRELLEGSHRPDLVSILLPHHLHLETARPFLEAGIGMQMQKPIGLAIRDGQEIIDLARKHRTPLVVSEPAVLGRKNRREIDWVVSGDELGRPTLMIHQAVIDLKGGYFMTPWRHLKGMAGAGWFIDHGVHQTHWMLEALGPCETAYAQTEQIESSRSDQRWGKMEVDTEDLACAVFRFASGAIVQFTVMSAGKGKTHWCNQVFGTKGSWNGKFTAAGSETEKEISAGPENPGTPEDSFAHSYQELLDRVKKWDAPVIGSPEKALEAEAMIYACLESAKTGAVVRVKDILSGKLKSYEETVWQAREKLGDVDLKQLT